MHEDHKFIGVKPKNKLSVKCFFDILQYDKDMPCMRQIIISTLERVNKRWRQVQKPKKYSANSCQTKRTDSTQCVRIAFCKRKGWVCC